MFFPLLGKRKKREENDVTEVNIEKLISKVSDALKGKNDDDVLYQRDDKILYLNILYPNKITIDNLKDVNKLEHVNETILQKNSKRKAITLIVILEKHKNSKHDTNLQLHEEKIVSSKIKRSVYYTSDKVVTSRVMEEFKNKKSISFDFFKDSLRMCIIECI